MRSIYLERHERMDRELSALSASLQEVNETLDRIQQDKVGESTVHRNIR